jgi:hypothetical protein
MEIAMRFGKWFSANWERMLFVAVGLAFLGTCFYLLYAQKVTEAAAVFGLGFLSFMYANVSRFKRFKGLGFEAELWEDKKKEAADLIERLREVVSIYTREVILGKVTSGRWGGKVDWGGRWKLYDDLVTQHNVLGQKIDFSGVKKEMDDFFLFDMTMPEINKIREAAIKGRSAAGQKIDQEFGSPIRDSEGYNKRVEQYRAIQEGVEDPFEISTKSDLAGHALNVWHDTKRRLKRDFDVEAHLDPKVHERLEKIPKLYQSRPVQVTDELIGWANREG